MFGSVSNTDINHSNLIPQTEIKKILQIIQMLSKTWALNSLYVTE